MCSEKNCLSVMYAGGNSITSNRFGVTLPSVDSRPQGKAVWYTLFAHTCKLPRILVIVNCSIFVSMVLYDIRGILYVVIPKINLAS